MTVESRTVGYDLLVAGTESLLSSKNNLEKALDSTKNLLRERLVELEGARKAELQKILIQGNLGCCTEEDHSFGNTDEEQVGVFPVSQLTKWYVSKTWYSRGDHYSSGSSGRVTKIEVLCQYHLGGRKRSVYHSDIAPGVDIECSVKEKDAGFFNDGRFFTDINEIDVTDQIKPVEPGEKVYRHFGFASLPKVD